MALSNDVLEVLRLYKNHIDKDTTATRLGQLWDLLSSQQQTDLRNFLENGLLAELFLKATISQLNTIVDGLTSQQKTTVFNAMKTDLVNFLNSENDDEIDLVNNTNI